MVQTIPSAESLTPNEGENENTKGSLPNENERRRTLPNSLAKNANIEIGKPADAEN